MSTDAGATTMNHHADQLANGAGYGAAGLTGLFAVVDGDAGRLVLSVIGVVCVPIINKAGQALIAAIAAWQAVRLAEIAARKAEAEAETRPVPPKA